MGSPQEALVEWWPSLTTTALAGTSFMVGMVLGRKMNAGFGRIANLVTVGPTKLALVVRQDLSMGKGKVISQCCHGTLTAYQQTQRSHPQLVSAWELSGQPKVVLKATDLNHLNQLSEMALKAGLPVAVVKDAGRTQIPSGSLTVLAVGPARSSDVDKVTGSLKLL